MNDIIGQEYNKNIMSWITWPWKSIWNDFTRDCDSAERSKFSSYIPLLLRQNSRCVARLNCNNSKIYSYACMNYILYDPLFLARSSSIDLYLSSCMLYRSHFEKSVQYKRIYNKNWWLLMNNNNNTVRLGIAQFIASWQRIQFLWYAMEV